MERKTSILLLLTLFLGLSLTAQTKMIAHKSHSGQESTFSINSSDNVGLVEYIDSVIKISDTSIAIVMFPFNTRDTVFDEIMARNPKITLDSLQNHYYSGATMVGFEEYLCKQERKKLKKERKEAKSLERKQGQNNEFFFTFPKDNQDPNNGGIIYLFLLTFVISCFSFFAFWKNHNKTNFELEH